MCLKRKITRVSCRRRTGTAVPRAEHFGDLITADHKILRVISSAFQKSQQDSEATWNNCLQLSIPTNKCTNAVFFIVWEIYRKYHDESMGVLNVHLAVWRMLLYTTLQALISIGKI